MLSPGGQFNYKKRKLVLEFFKWETCLGKWYFEHCSYFALFLRHLHTTAVGVEAVAAEGAATRNGRIVSRSPKEAPQQHTCWELA